MNLFMKPVVKEYKQWHKRLLMSWLKMGAEEKKAGELTLKALLLNVSETIFAMGKDECMPILKVW